MLSVFSDEFYMKEALKEAQKAYDLGEIPVGAIVVSNHEIIAKAHNLTEQLNDVTAHAEILAITAATQKLGNKYLDKCTLYVTLEPCVMCCGALGWSQIGKIVYGASDSKRGYTLLSSKALHPKTIVKKGILEEACSSLMRQFFKERRK